MTTSKILNRLRFWLSAKEWIYRSYPEYILGDTPEEYRIFIDRGSDILFVAHLDTVLPPMYMKSTKKNIWASGLDDRLGCAIATELGRELGADVLLCDHEEEGKSTAFHHKLKKYNWIAEFDREEDDVVTYDLDSLDFIQAIRKYWNKGIGSFTDICSMDTSTCCMNVGIGIKYSHSKNSYVNKKQLRSQIEAFKEFHSEYKDVKFEQDYRTFMGKDCDAGYGFSQRQYEYTYAGDYGNDMCDFCGMVSGSTLFSYH